MRFSVREIFLFLLVFRRSLHFPIIRITHLYLEQHNNLLVFKQRTQHRRGFFFFLLTDHVAFECLGVVLDDSISPSAV